MALFNDLNSIADEKDNTPAKKTTAASAYKPGFLEPGSRSDAIVRGFSSGATLGLAPKISAGVNSLFGNGDYATNLKQYLDANRTASAAHPVASGVANLVGSAPSLIAGSVGSLPVQIAKQAALGGAESYGSSEKKGVELAKDVATGAAISGGVASALPVVGKVVGLARDVVKGTPNVAKIADAANKFRNAPVPPTAGQVTPGSAKKAWAGLQNPANTSTEVMDQLIKEMPNTLTPAQMKAVIASHNVNAPTAQSVARGVATDAAIGAGTTAIPTFFATEGDLGKTLGAATAGAVGGAAYGGKRAVTGANARLRMPAPSPTAIEQGAYNVTRPFVLAGQQAVAGNIKETADVGTNPFGRLTNYLSQSAGATNPDVQRVAEQAQGIADSNDPDAKRKSGMILQDTPEGRAVSNSTSPYRDLNLEAD